MESRRGTAGGLAGCLVVAMAISVMGIGGLLSPAAAQAGTTTVRVGKTLGPVIQTQLSTNDVWSGMLTQTPHGQAELNALHARLVRIHVGDDGYPEAMPEIVRGGWNLSALNALVDEVFASGARPLMNIKFAPDWQWTCSTPQSGQPGAVRDTTFQEYAQYMARLVSYYNRGYMITESGGVIENPVGRSHAIRYWEPWNEPDLNNETPCAPSSGYGLTPQQYVTMWNAVTSAMLRVDPTLRFVGPATAGSQFGSSPATGNEYVDLLMAGSVTKPAAISFHGYGYWDNAVSDEWIFNGDRSDPSNACCGGIPDLLHGITTIRRHYPKTPVWLTEVNVNAGWDNDPFRRPWSEFAAAWWASVFQRSALTGVGMIQEYDIVDSPQFGLINDQTGHPYIAYYVFQLLDRAFSPGSVVLSSTTSDPGILSLAARQSDGAVSVMVVDRKLASADTRSRCGRGGIPATVNIKLAGLKPRRITLQRIDRANVNCGTGAGRPPGRRSLSPARTIKFGLPGYGVAVLSIVPAHGAGNAHRADAQNAPRHAAPPGGVPSRPAPR